jgi:hypothetical protein
MPSRQDLMDTAASLAALTLVKGDWHKDGRTMMMTSIDQRLTTFVSTALQIAHQLEDLASLRAQVNEAELQLRRRVRPRANARSRGAQQIRVRPLMRRRSR